MEERIEVERSEVPVDTPILGTDGHGNPSIRGHVPALDGIRGIAILTVMFFHFTVISGATEFDLMMIDFVGSLRGGVDLFFCLSGFLITGILIDTRGRTGYFLNFFARRALRILPLYYAVVFISLVVLPSIPHPKANNFGRIAGDEWYYWTMLSNFSVGLSGAWRHAILDVTWSVAIEEQFYLIWPFVVMSFGLKSLHRLCLAIILACPCLRISGILAGLDHDAIYVITPFRADSLAGGAWLAVLIRMNSGLGMRMARYSMPAIVVGGLGTLVTYVIMNRWEAGLITDIGRHALSYSFLLCLSAGLVLHAIFCRPGSLFYSIITSGSLTFLGRYSYAIYLTHVPIRAIIRDIFFAPDVPRFEKAMFKFPTLLGSEMPGQIIFYIPCIIACCAAGWLSWHVFEKHVLGLKKFFVFKRGSEQR